MRAAAVPSFGAKVELIEVTKPQPKNDQILVKILVAAINPFDWKVADGILEGKAPHVFPLVLGNDAAGIVESCGADVTNFSAGDTIFGQFLHMPLGEGPYAEYARVPASNLLKKLPGTLDILQAAALPTAGMTALQMIEQLELPKGSTVLIVGATGGVGSFAVQLASTLGLKVIATARAAKAAHMSEFGATATIDHTSSAVSEQLRQLYPEGIDGLIDLMSDAAEFSALASQVRKGGTAFTTAFVANDSELQKLSLKGGNFELSADHELLDRLVDHVVKGGVIVPVDKVISLDEVPETVEQSRKGRSAGKTLIKLG
ncbi:NADP-dependent oxidoreductase [Phyllobacterium sp. YR531]|uniref:NADP-dependent oxidoreductase n=1 Tax=Phyllobacterium sp. YR531 TaxID=1144343 RepID=UPI00026FCC6D|nr:NADP-dependent oxidoreductase [Phyllobacterium sp. YR531]EJN02424.1 Zn-dependent oxidoreductase, NADPH:quinone reductase [Phyllobacterium sp. YR531]